MNLNIAIMVSSLSYGGAEKQAVIDANILSGEHQVWLITFKDGPQKGLLNNEIHYTIFEKRGYIKTAYKLAQFMKANRIDIIHTSLFAPIIITSLATLFKRVPVIWHFHSHEYEAPWYSRMTYIICARFRGVRNIFFVNKELEDYLSKRFLLPRKKTGVMYNSTSFTDRIPSQKNGNKIVIGYTGRIIELKRIHYLIGLGEYLLKNRINNFVIMIVGDGEERKELEKLTKEKGLERYIHFTGFQKDTQRYYSQFDIFVNPSREECLSIALIDAGIMGTTSVAFDLGGNSEIIENQKSGVIVTTKVEFFENVKALIEDREKRAYYGANAKEVCNAKFSQFTRKRRLTDISQLFRNKKYRN
jgi:glycosyltransferase involved in cell wall biosynthesis